MKQAGCSCETWVTGIFKYKNLGSHKYGSSQWLEIYKVVFTELLGVQVWQGDGVKLALWLQAVFFCLPDMPHGKNTAIRYRNQCGFCKIARASAAENDAFGIWAYWSVPNGSGCRAPCLWQRKMLALGIFSLLSLTWCTLAPQWVLIDGECHLQSLNILPATSTPSPPLCLFHCPP